MQSPVASGFTDLSNKACDLMQFCGILILGDHDGHYGIMSLSSSSTAVLPATGTTTALPAMAHRRGGGWSSSFFGKYTI